MKPLRLYLYPEKLEVLKTKVNLTISQPLDQYESKEDAVVDLLIKAVLTGASANAINQLIPEGCLDDDDFDAILYARVRVLDIAKDLKRDLKKLVNVVPTNHRFH